MIFVFFFSFFFLSSSWYFCYFALWERDNVNLIYIFSGVIRNPNDRLVEYINKINEKLSGKLKKINVVFSFIGPAFVDTMVA